jgi:hypothetical protein
MTSPATAVQVFHVRVLLERDRDDLDPRHVVGAKITGIRALFHIRANAHPIG